MKDLIKKHLKENFSTNMSADDYYNQYEEVFFGPLPKHPLKAVAPGYRDTVPDPESTKWTFDRRSRVQTANLYGRDFPKPILGYDGEDVYVIVNDAWTKIDNLITVKEYWVIFKHVMNVYHDLRNTPGPGWSHNVRQRVSFILDENYKPYKLCMYSVKTDVFKILQKYQLL